MAARRRPRPSGSAAYLRAVAAAARARVGARSSTDVAAFAPAAEIYERNTRAAARRVREIIGEGVASGDFGDVHVGFVADVVASTMVRIQSAADRGRHRARRRRGLRAARHAPGAGAAFLRSRGTPGTTNAGPREWGPASVREAGGGYGIRTREGVTPTRFPIVRLRPLGQSSARRVRGRRIRPIRAAPSVRRGAPADGYTGPRTPRGVHPVNSPRAGRQQGSAGSGGCAGSPSA